MSHFRSLLCRIGACGVLLLSSYTLSAQSIPQQMSYQGVIRQGDKVPADGSYQMTFTIYSSITGSQPIWSETQTVQLRGGLFNVYLGEVKALPSPMPANAWVGMRLGNEEEFSRTKLTSVPFALSAETAQALAPDAKGAVLSLNGQQGALELRGNDGLTVNNDNGVLTIGLSTERKAEEALTTTEWLLAGNTNASATSWLGTSNNFPLVIKTNNTERMRILSTGNGNVGIGDNNPGSRLTVAKTFHLTNAGGAPELKLSAASGANSTTFKTGTQSSNIVYTLPSNDGDNGDILSTDGTGDLVWIEQGWGTSGNSNISSSKFLGTTNSQPLIIKTNNTERFRVTSGGAMGINEDNPSQKLEVSGNILIKPDGSGTGELRIQESGGGTGNNYTAFKAPNLGVNITYTLPNIAPLADQVLTSSSLGVLSWTTPTSGATGTAGGDLDGTYPNPQIAAGVIVDADISGTANIAYGKLNLTGAIVNSDISNSANIDYSKLDLTGNIVDADISGTAAIAYSKLDLAGNIVDADISGTAAIAYSKLDLTGAIVNADVSGTAAIAYSKLDLTDGIVNADINTAAAIAYSKLDLAGSIVDADISGTAAIAYSKLDLAGNIVDADISGTAAIAYSKLDLAGNIVDADISGTAAIAYSKLDLTGAIVNADVSGTAAIAYSKLDLAGNIVDADISGTAAIAYSKLDLTGNITNSDVSATAAIAYSKLDLAGGIVNSDVSNSAAIAYSKLDLAGSIVDADISGTAAIAYSKLDLAGNIVDADISGTAAIAYSKLDLTGNITNSDVSATAAIAYSKLDLAGGIVNSDVSNSAAIAYSKLDLAGSIVDADISGTAAIAYSKLDLAGNITNSDVSATAAIAYSKLDLANSIVAGDITSNAVTTAKIANNAVDGAKIAMGSDATGDLMYYDGTDYVRLPIGSNSDVLTVTGGIPAWGAGGGLSTVTHNATLSGNGTGGSPLGINLGNSNTWTANQTFASTFLITSNTRIAMTNSDNNSRDLRIQEPSGTGTQYIGLRAPSVTNNGNYVLPAVVGTVGQVLTLQTSNNIDSATTHWTTPSGGAPSGAAGGDLSGTYPNPDIAAGVIVNADINSSAAIAYSKLNLTNSIVSGDIAAGTIDNSDISGTAAIAYSKLNITNSIVAGDITSNAVTTAKIADNNVTGAKIAMGSDATGDIMYYNGTDYTRRAIGSTGNVLTVSGGVPTWAAPSGGGGTVDLLATKTSSQTLPIGGNSVTPDDLTFNTTVTSPSIGSFNGTTYTVGATGLYMIMVNVIQTSATIAGVAPQVLVDGSTAVYGVATQLGNLPTGTFGRGSLVTILSLTSGDAVTIKCANASTAATVPISTDGTTRITIIKF